MVKTTKQTNLISEFIKNQGFSVSLCPKEVIRQDGTVLINNNPRAGRYCGIWNTKRKLVPTSAAMTWKYEYIVADTESEVWEIYHRRFQETYRKLIDDSIKNFS